MTLATLRVSVVCDVDTAYLLMFLRGAKFSQLRAREMIDGLMTHVTSLPTWFRNIDTHEPRLLKAIDTG